MDIKIKTIINHDYKPLTTIREFRQVFYQGMKNISALHDVSEKKICDKYSVTIHPLNNGVPEKTLPSARYYIVNKSFGLRRLA